MGCLTTRKSQSILESENTMSFLKNFFEKQKSGKKPELDDSQVSEPASPAPVRPSAPKRPRPDVNQPVENPRLKALMEKWRENASGENTSNVLEEIVLRAWFLSVFESSEEPRHEGGEKAVFEKDTVLSFPMLSGADGKMFHPVFTDWEELGRWQGLATPPKTLILSFDDLHTMVAKREDVAGVVVNPFGVSFSIPRERMNSLKERKELAEKGATSIEVEKETQVMLGEPRVYPDRMVRAISEHLRQHPEVSRVWLRLMVREKEQSFLLVVDFSGEAQEVFGGIADAARPFLNGMFLDMVPLDSSFGQQATEGVEPVYRR